jgi:hypothetical protein
LLAKGGAAGAESEFGFCCLIEDAFVLFCGFAFQRVDKRFVTAKQVGGILSV